MDRIIQAALAVIAVSVIALLVLNPAASAGAGKQVKTPLAGLSKQPAALAAGSGSPQTFTLGFDGKQYTPAEIRVKQGTKVRITADPGSLTGCMSTVNIDGYGISKFIKSGDNVIEFTADTAGTFPIHCNMGMGNGKLVVEDAAGTVPVQSQTPAIAKGTGGCTCSTP